MSRLIDVDIAVILIKNLMSNGAILEQALDAQSTAFELDDIQAFLMGEWVESKKVQELLGMSFENCVTRFDLSRVANWWSIVGKTEEERQRNGQKIETFFRLKGGTSL